MNLISTPVGSGKSIALPVSFFLHSLRRGEIRTKILVSVPTRLLAESLAKTVKQFVQVKVGFAQDRIKNYGPDTQIIYATTNHVKNILWSEYQRYLECKGKNEYNYKFPYSYLFIDEVHVPNVYNELLMGFINMVNSEGSKDGIKGELSNRVSYDHNNIKYTTQPTLMNGFLSKVKKILLSATPDLEYLQTIFDDKINLISSEETELELKNYHVDIHYSDQTISNKWSVARKEILKKTLDVLVEHWNLIADQGSVLVFVPGCEDCDNLAEDLKDVLRINNPLSTSLDVIGICSIHSNSLQEQMNEIYNPKTKVIFATNIAETGITIPNVKIIIDSMLYKQSKLKKGTYDTILELKYISQSTAIQRTGRTGRVSHGISYRMCTESFFENNLPKYLSPEWRRINMMKHVLDMINFNLSPELILKVGTSWLKLNYSDDLYTKLNPPGDKTEYFYDVYCSLETLGLIKIISQNQDQGFHNEILPKGQFFSSIPHDDLRIINYIYLAYGAKIQKKKEFLGMVLFICSAISSSAGTIFDRKVEQDIKMIRDKKIISYNYSHPLRQSDDVRTYLNILSLLVDYYKMQFTGGTLDNFIGEFAVNYKLNSRKILQILNTWLRLYDSPYLRKYESTKELTSNNWFIELYDAELSVYVVEFFKYHGDKLILTRYSKEEQVFKKIGEPLDGILLKRNNQSNYLATRHEIGSQIYGLSFTNSVGFEGYLNFFVE
jgi:HrpA-like RNA helicase